MRRVITVAVFLVCVSLWVGCASTPSRYYTLSAVTLPPVKQTDVSIAVGPVSVPEDVDRPEFVVRTGPNQVRLDEFNLWAAPLQSNIARVVAENLGAMLGTKRVTLFPQTLSADADYRTSIEVQSFVSTPGEAASLDAVWTVRRIDGDKTESGRTTVTERVQGGSYEALAAAHSNAVAQLSREIANAVRALEGAVAGR